ncbi:hypothetical protein J437_LFUL014921 [Ladona fulva]|uniref:Uncharacterized protein n=1 Tax=Ladona fulva TaxID=123851 RepID=A0A8K0KMK7_LADFU|nr:hypothetical protein J437_LFUL014921 [Ladona fulva]
MMWNVTFILCELKSKLSAQQSVFVRPISKSKNATTASFKIAHLLAKKIKPFQDGELLSCSSFLAGAESFFEGFFNKRESISAIQELQLSDSTVLRRIDAIGNDMQSQLKRDVEMCEWFSLRFDVSNEVHFPNMKKMTNDGNFEGFTGHLKKLMNQFEKRFQDFSCLEPLVSVFVNPFTTKQQKPQQL